MICLLPREAPTNVFSIFNVCQASQQSTTFRQAIKLIGIADLRQIIPKSASLPVVQMGAHLGTVGKNVNYNDRWL